MIYRTTYDAPHSDARFAKALEVLNGYIRLRCFSRDESRPEPIHLMTTRRASSCGSVRGTTSWKTASCSRAHRRLRPEFFSKSDSPRYRTQRSLDLLGESVRRSLATTRRPSFPMMMKMMKIRMMTKKMNQTRISITSLSTSDYQDLLPCLLGEAGYNPNDTHPTRERRKDVGLTTSAVSRRSIVSYSDDSALFRPWHGSRRCTEYAVLQNSAEIHTNRPSRAVANANSSPPYNSHSHSLTTGCTCTTFSVQRCRSAGGPSTRR
jgi:hypothetical protein